MKRKFSLTLAVSAAVFLLMTALLCSWVADIRQDSHRRQLEALELALNRSLMLCYSLEGSYPATLEQLLEKYPLTYDRQRFTVDYRLQGSNILPEITILENPR